MCIVITLALALKLPDNLRNLLFKLVNNKQAAGEIAYVVARNHDKLPENVKNLLLKMASDKETAKYLAKVIVSHFYEIRRYITNEMRDDMKEAAKDIGYNIDFNFDSLPEDVRN